MIVVTQKPQKVVIKSPRNREIVTGNPGPTGATGPQGPAGPSIDITSDVVAHSIALNTSERVGALRAVGFSETKPDAFVLPPTGGSVSFDYSGGNIWNSGYYWGAYVYAVKVVDGIKYYSSALDITGTYDDGAQNAYYSVTLSWLPSANADYYEVYVLGNLYGYYYDYYAQTTATNIIDTGSNFPWSANYVSHPIASYAYPGGLSGPIAGSFDGYVGIGTKYPDYPLHVVGESRFVGRQVVQDSLGFTGNSTAWEVRGATGNPCLGLYSNSGIDGQELPFLALNSWYPSGLGQGSYIGFSHANAQRAFFLGGELEPSGQGGFAAMRCKEPNSGAFYDPAIFYSDGVVTGEDYNTISTQQPAAPLEIKNRFYSTRPNVIIRVHSGQTTNALEVRDQFDNVLALIDVLGGIQGGL